MSFPDPKTFCHAGGIEPPDLRKQGCHSSTSLTVLPELTGKPWDEVALAYVMALRPSVIRVCEIGHLDSWPRRVTVWMKDDKISRIQQEVDVCLPDGIVHGTSLKHALRYGKDSPQVKWHLDAEGYVYDGINGEYYKQVKGKEIPFPHE